MTKHAVAAAVSIGIISLTVLTCATIFKQSIVEGECVERSIAYHMRKFLEIPRPYEIRCNSLATLVDMVVNVVGWVIAVFITMPLYILASLMAIGVASFACTIAMIAIDHYSNKMIFYCW
jgi:hypothetical protein